MPDLLFELQCEELPPLQVAGATEALARALEASLTEAGFGPERVSWAWTPRRMAAWAHGLPARSPDSEERVKGPPENVAFDDDGNPTPAAVGFAKRNGLTVDALEREGGRLFAVVRTLGRGAAEAAAEVLPTLPARVPWKKSMRWGGPITFARPIRGVTALLDGEIVACVVAGLEAGRTTPGHPFLAPGLVTLASASRQDYVDALRDAFVLADPDERRAAVLASARASVPGLEVREALLDEVTNLLQWPTALVGAFDPAYLALPPRLLETVMAYHQRFFPVRDGGGKLEARFIAVADRAEGCADVCRPGFERVLLPRFHDARFFFDEDRKAPLEARLPELESMAYHRKLGSMAEKTARLVALAPAVAGLLGLDDAAAAHAARAARLCKCDLVTYLVGEFPELQGHVGSVYAAADGEPPEVCAAIDAQYVHGIGDDDAVEGAALALLLAENLDVLCQFGTRVGLPSGSADPFGVRRAAITLLDALERWAPDLDLPAALAAAGGDDAVAAYLDTRLRQRLRKEGARPDHLEAVLCYPSVGAFRGRVDDLVELSGHPSWDRLLEVAERCRNITKKSDAGAGEVREELLSEDAEKALFAAWSEVRSGLPERPSPLTRDHVAAAAEALADPLHRFFDEVFVNAEDAAVRGNRHALLLEIDAAFLRFADLCRVQRKGGDAA